MPSLEVIITQMLNGVSIGLSIALIAMGLTIVFGTMDIVNLAHGEFYMMAGFGIWLLLPLVGNFWLAVVISAIVVGAISIGIEQLSFRPLRGRDPSDTLIVSFGILLITQQAALTLFGGTAKSVQQPFSGTISITGGFAYSSMRTALIVGGVIMIAATWLFLERTRLGTLIRATAQDLETAKSLGVPANRIFVMTFSLSAILAAIAASFLIPIRSVVPSSGVGVVIDAFIVIIVGGLGSIPGAVVAALLVGLIQAMSAIWLPPWAAEVAVYGLLIVVLLFKPEGLMGDRIQEH